MQSRGTQVTSMQVLTFQLWHLAGACFVAVISFFILSSPQSAIFVAYVLSKHRLAYIACASAGLQWWPVRHVRLTAHTSALFVCVLSVCPSVCVCLSFCLFLSPVYAVVVAFPCVRGFWEYVRQFIPRPRFSFFFL